MSARPQRPATLTFCQAVLALQSLAAFFAVLALWGLSRAGETDIPAGLLWGGGLGLVVLLGYAVGQQRKRWGRWLGWALQVPMLLGGFIDSTIAVIGATFLVTWIIGLRLGARIDRERAQRAAAEDAEAPAGDVADGAADPATAEGDQA
ncbi:DUF4233 domain-containing protein [Demequina sp. SYSU T00192]|uniref:DUF4233 domain-containing protein n=1 Tax=Demequina litoralis TaxID=3051660 RepID=A0ABT8G9B8_9MICO|nr:DUF4233 domain-containing protein [Demequina sp. SYSU T00192]MDN4475735.1 DUF4233 domain-containing protein [Demequina sp. SYSU T00192]